MPGERQRTASVVCPRCKSLETVRSGAFNFERRSQDAGLKQESVVYDRVCQACGHHFPEPAVEGRD